MAKYRNKRKGKYRSILESNIASYLESNGIEFKYEPIKFVLQEKLSFPTWEKNRKNKFCLTTEKREISYTPDFIGDGWIIEGKGLRTPDFNNKWKIFQKYIKDNKLDYKLFLIQRLKDLVIFKQVISNEEVDNQGNRSNSGENSGYSRATSRRSQGKPRIRGFRKILHR